MRAYLDASVLVPLFLADPFTQRAEALLRTESVAPIIADWAALEVSNVISRRVRIQALAGVDAARILADFDVWRGRAAVPAETGRADVALAIQFVRRFDLALRGADALHIAIAHRLGARLFTFDERMAKAAQALGVLLAP